MSSYTFGSSTLYSCNLGGLTHTMTRTPINTDIIEKQAPLGNGYFLKKRGKTASDISIEFKYLATSISSIFSIYQNIDQVNLYTLTSPNFGSVPNCRLVQIGDLQIEDIIKTVPKQYVLKINLTFREYPV
jgi:hypothetical protein